MYVVRYTHEDCHKHGKRNRQPQETWADGQARLHNGLCPFHSEDDPCAVVEHVEGVEVAADGRVIAR